MNMPGTVNTFQYPLTDRSACNDMEDRADFLMQLSFSILLRIDLPVTLYPLKRLNLLCSFSILLRIDLPVTPYPFIVLGDGTDFQYPLTDRSACNLL